MSKVIDLRMYREKLWRTISGKLHLDDGVYMEASPPFIIFRQYQAGVICKEWRVLSEYMVREIMDNLPDDSWIM